MQTSPDRAIKTLRRRLDFLRGQAAVVEPREGWRGVSFIRAEIRALELALAAFEDAQAVGLDDLGRMDLERRAEVRALLESKGQAA